MVAKLLGYRTGTSKAGNSYMMAFVSSAFSAREIAEGALGEKAETVFIPATAQGKVTPLDVGHDIDLIYEISGGKAYLTDCTPERLFQ